ncbi:hypothetical protein DYU11_21775 [Fibrisoma montanum]|uniref:PsbP C-terminal domain-containing protein n=1 Tax=Fibrisoma montanum TaxID=2305895 RepID=A0A418M4C5_9BACT|nr:hypothetical protein [Fibrisoma montanum]RIV20667.1 hypothetical protein DYU11_21775 [Fibrisoma montanum]
MNKLVLLAIGLGLILSTRHAQAQSAGNKTVANDLFRYQITLPTGWVSQPLDMYDVLPNTESLRKGFSASSTSAAASAVNGLQLYKEADPNWQLFVFAHKKPTLSKEQFVDNANAASKLMGATPAIQEAQLGSLPGYEVTTTAGGMTFVTRYAYRNGIRYGISATYRTDQFEQLRPAYEQVAASFRLGN